jgi:hypothetical protein
VTNFISSSNGRAYIENVREQDAGKLSELNNRRVDIA